MTYKIVLPVKGIDFDDERTLMIIGEQLADLAWASVDDRVTATLFTDATDPVSATVDASHRIEHALPWVKVDRVDEELCGIADMAARLHLNRETVRSWTNGTRGPGAFPTPRASLGGGKRGSMKVWAWAEANAWLQRHYCLGDEYRYLTVHEVAEVNAHLARIDRAADQAWRTASSGWIAVVPPAEATVRTSRHPWSDLTSPDDPTSNTVRVGPSTKMIAR